MPTRICYKEYSQGTLKMTTEMNKAIQRHERNIAYDYWNAGFSGMNTSPTPSPDRRPTFQKMTQINLNFPGIFLPKVERSSCKNKDNAVQSPYASPFSLSRSKSTMTSATPKRKPTDRGRGLNGSVLDLTCMQFSDSLIAYTGPHFSGLGIVRNPLRMSDLRYYVDSLVEDEYDGNGHMENVDKVPRVSGCGGQDSESEASVTSGTNVQNYKGNVIKSSYRLLSPKPQKSILKNKSCKHTAANGDPKTATGLDTSNISNVGSYHLAPQRESIVPSATAYSRQRSKVTINSVRPILYNGYTLNRLRRRFPSANSDSSHSDHSRLLTDSVEYIHGRKRIVRFNSSHQVREDIPCNPVSQLYNEMG